MVECAVHDAYICPVDLANNKISHHVLPAQI
jgi:hypothetical protein